MYRVASLGLALLMVGCGDSGGDPPPSDGGGDVTLCERPALEITHTAGSANDAIEHLVDTGAHPDAVCNDGTPAAYVVRPGFGAGAHRWVIYLEGGGNCSTGDACLTRSNQTPFYMTSSSFHEGDVYGTVLDGIKSTSAAVNPDFYDATFVQVVYCSSDLWTGDVAADSGAPIDTMGHWHFRGRAIVAAVIDELLAKGLAEADEVLLAGSSAGGIGVFNRADDVAAKLSPGTRFLALSDAGFFIDYPEYDATTKLESTAVPTAHQQDLLNGITGWGGGGDVDCEAAAQTDLARARCRSAFDLLHDGHVQSRVFIRQSELDAVQLKLLNLGKANMSVEANAYRMRFVTEMVRELDLLTNVGLFVTRDTEHGVVNDPAWLTVGVSGVKLPVTFGAWYRDPCTASVHVAR